MATDYLALSLREYSARLEEATCHTAQAGVDQDGEPCWFLVDPCGDYCGDPWHRWQDFVFDTYPAIERYESQLDGLATACGYGED